MHRRGKGYSGQIAGGLAKRRLAEMGCASELSQANAALKQRLSVRANYTRRRSSLGWMRLSFRRVDLFHG